MKAHLVRPGELSTGDSARWQSVQDGNPLLRSPFYSPHFTRAVGETRKDARVAILERDGDIIGFFPFHRVRGGVGKPIGGPINDYHGPILEAGIEVAADALLRSCGLMAYDFNHLPLAVAPLSTGAYVTSKSRYIDLSDGYGAYAKDRGKTFNKAMREMRRRTRKAETDLGGPVVFTAHDRDPETYAAHAALKEGLFARDRVASILQVGWVRDTLEIIRTTEVPEFAGLMSTVRAGDRLMGSHFGMRSGRDWHWWFPAYDLNLYKYGPGIMVIHGAAQEAAGKGFSGSISAGATPTTRSCSRAIGWTCARDRWSGPAAPPGSCAKGRRACWGWQSRCRSAAMRAIPAGHWRA